VRLSTQAQQRSRSPSFGLRPGRCPGLCQQRSGGGRLLPALAQCPQRLLADQTAQAKPVGRPPHAHRQMPLAIHAGRWHAHSLPEPCKTLPRWPHLRAWPSSPGSLPAIRAAGMPVTDRGVALLEQGVDGERLNPHVKIKNVSTGRQASARGRSDQRPRQHAVQRAHRRGDRSVLVAPHRHWPAAVLVSTSA